MNNDNQALLQLQFARVLKNYKVKHRPFGGRHEFAKWYLAKLKEQDSKCFYCGISTNELEKLIDHGLLKTRKVRGEGMRGKVLEIDKQGEVYNPLDCCLACYYCNNDKSYTTPCEDYKQFFGESRKRYFDYLLSKLYMSLFSEIYKKSNF